MQSTWNRFPQFLHLELLLDLSPSHFQRLLKTFQFAGLGNDASWEHCWFEWHFTNIWLRYFILATTQAQIVTQRLAFERHSRHSEITITIVITNTDPNEYAQLHMY